MIKVREGRKVNEIGNIPDTWEIKPLIDVSDKNDRYAFSGGPFGSDLTAKEYQEDGVQVIQLQNIGDGHFNDDNKVFVSDKKADELAKCNIYPGEIIIAKMAEPVARACIIPNKRKRYVMASDGIRLKVNEEINDTTYLLYAINSNYFRKNAIKASTGTTRLRIGLGELGKLPLLVPPLYEQQKIAEILSSVDEQIETTEQLIAETKELKQGLLQQLLTKGIGHTEFKKSKIGIIPDEWGIKNIKEISSFCANGFVGTATPFYVDEDIGTFYLQGNNIRENRIDFTKKMYINEEFKTKYQRAKVFENDILTVQSGHIGTSCPVPKELDGSYCHALIITRPIDQKINSGFLSYYLNAPSTFARMKNIFVGSTIKHINTKDFVKFQVAVPPLEEQQKIANILSSVDDQIEIYEQEKAEFEQLKRGLMQKLLTGEIRVNVEEVSV